MIHKAGCGGVNVNLSHFLDISLSILVVSWKKRSNITVAYKLLSIENHCVLSLSKQSPIKRSRICLIWANILLTSHIFYHSPISNLLFNIMTLDPDILNYKFCNDRLPEKKSYLLKVIGPQLWRRNSCFKIYQAALKSTRRLPSFSNYWLRISVSFLQDLPS